MTGQLEAVDLDAELDAIDFDAKLDVLYLDAELGAVLTCAKPVLLAPRLNVRCLCGNAPTSFTCTCSCTYCPFASKPQQKRHEESVESGSRWMREHPRAPSSDND